MRVLQGNKRVCVLMVCFVVWHAVGCLEQHGCCSIDHPLYEQDLLGDALFWVSFLWVLFVGVVCCVRTV